MVQVQVSTLGALVRTLIYNLIIVKERNISTVFSATAICTHTPPLYYQKIINEGPKLFCSKTEYKALGKEFFENPYVCIRKEKEYLKKHKKIQYPYCILYLTI